MKKILLSVLPAICCVAMFSACTPEKKVDEGGEKENLSVPELSSELIDFTSFRISWNSVENAASYVYDLDGTSDVTAETSVEFTGLEPGSSHVVKVKAVAQEGGDYLDSDWAEIKVTLEQEEVDPFTVTCNVEGKIVYVDVIPADKQMTYYSEILTEADYNDYGGEPEKAFGKMLEFYKEVFKDGAFDFLKDQGDINYFMDMDAYGIKAYVLTAGIDQDLNITTEVCLTPFETDPLPHSDNKFDIKLLEKGTAMAYFQVTPSNNDPYTMVLMEKEDIADYSEADLISLFSNEYKGWIREHLYNGEMTMTYKQDIFPDTEYVLFVFGWDTAPTTDLNRYEFRTDKANEDENITFEFSVNTDNPEEILISIKPSDKDVLYYSTLMKKSEYETYGPDNILDYVTKICESGGLPVYMYFEWFASIGDTEKSYYHEEGDYEYDTEYVLLACPLKLDGEEVYMYSARLYDETIIVPSK